MTVKEVIQRYSHLDAVLSDAKFCAGSIGYDIAHNLWIGLKAAAADLHNAGQRNDDMAASLPAWIDVTVLLPASGEKVLAWDGHNVLRAMYAKRFTEETRPGGEDEATEYSEGLDGYFLVEGWYEHNEFDEVHWTIENPVTHWMPLPAPPEAACS